jgi:hypothetical protein
LKGSGWIRLDAKHPAEISNSPRAQLHSGSRIHGDEGWRIRKGGYGSGLLLAAKQNAEQPTRWRQGLAWIVLIDASQSSEPAGCC